MVFVVLPPPVQGIGNAGGFRMMVEDRAGRGPQALLDAAYAMMGAAAQTPGLVQVFSLFENSTPQLYLDIDRTKAQLLGINVSDVFAALQIYLGSSYVNDFNLFGRTFRVTAQADRRRAHDHQGRARDPRAQLQRRHRAARLVHDRARHLRALPRAALQSLSGGRARRRRGARLSARARRSQIMEKLAAETLPDGFGYEWTTLAFQQLRAGNTAIFAFVLAVVFVFLVLAAQFESLTLPLAVILIVPMCLIASIVGVVLRGQDNNILTQVGFIVLIGLAAKNAILIVEFAKQLEDQGRDRGRRRGRGGAAAAAPDPDDVARLHLRRVAAGVGGRRRRRAAPDARHRGVLRHDRRDGLRPDLHAGVLRGQPLVRGARAGGARSRRSSRRSERGRYLMRPTRCSSSFLSATSASSRLAKVAASA